jgi:nuclear transport factor 2 (NTF2) superfamily protein
MEDIKFTREFGNRLVRPLLSFQGCRVSKRVSRAKHDDKDAALQVGHSENHRRNKVLVI